MLRVRSRGVEFIDENGGGAGVGLRKPSGNGPKKDLADKSNSDERLPVEICLKTSNTALKKNSNTPTLALDERVTKEK